LIHAVSFCQAWDDYDDRAVAVDDGEDEERLPEMFSVEDSHREAVEKTARASGRTMCFTAHTSLPSSRWSCH